MGDLNIERRLDGAVACLALQGEARVELIPALLAAIDHAVGQGAQHVLLDVSRLTFMDSASLGALLQAARDRGRAGGLLVLVKTSRAVGRVLDGCGMRSQFTLAETEDAARALLPS